jgi:plasmid maintenance system antidote protein VapI
MKSKYTEELRGWADAFMASFESDASALSDLLKMQVTEQILEIMREKNISRTDLARSLGCSKAFVTKLFSGTANVTIETMARMALAVDSEVHIQVSTRKATRASSAKKRKLPAAA